MSALLNSFNLKNNSTLDSNALFNFTVNQAITGGFLEVLIGNASKITGLDKIDSVSLFEEGLTSQTLINVLNYNSHTIDFSLPVSIQTKVASTSSFSNFTINGKMTNLTLFT